jgi:phasin family protein
MINGFEGVQKAGGDGLKRSLQSFGAMARGWQALTDETIGYTRQAFEDGAAHVEKLLGTKSVELAVEAQTDFVRTSYEKAMGQATRFGELYVELVREAVKPFEGYAPAAKK